MVYRLNHQMPQEPMRSVGSAQQDPKRHTGRQTLQSQGISPSSGLAIGGLRCTQGTNKVIAFSSWEKMRTLLNFLTCILYLRFIICLSICSCVHHVIHQATLGSLLFFGCLLCFKVFVIFVLLGVGALKSLSMTLVPWSPWNLTKSR